MGLFDTARRPARHALDELGDCYYSKLPVLVQRLFGRVQMPQDNPC